MFRDSDKAGMPTSVKNPIPPERRLPDDARLPDELRAELPDAWITRICDISEAAAADVAARIRELRVVENIEEFGANLERHGFLNRNDLRYSETRVVEARTMEESAIRCPKTSAIRTGQNTGHISALSSGKCVLVKVGERTGGRPGIRFVNRAHEIGHIGGWAARKRGISLAQP